MEGQRQKAERFRAMHMEPRGFLMPNAWDAGSAVVLAAEGFAVLGTTSAGIAFSLARPDFDVGDARLAVPRDAMLARIRQIVEAVPVPVNGDLEDGYGAQPEEVAATVRLAIAAGLAGGNIEDHDPRGPGVLFDEALAVERIRAARAAVEQGDDTFVVNAKTDALALTAGDGLHTSIRRGNLFLEAGADCVFPCGAGDLATVATLVREIDGPVNVVLGWGDSRLSVAALLDTGVARVSVGGSIARAALGFVRACGRELHERGTADYAQQQIPQRALNALFGAAGRP